MQVLFAVQPACLRSAITALSHQRKDPVFSAGHDMRNIYEPEHSIGKGIVRKSQQLHALQQDVFQLEGESYARAKGHADERIGAWYNKKYISLSCERKYDDLCYSHDLVGVIEEGFAFLMPYYEFFDKSYRMAD